MRTTGRRVPKCCIVGPALYGPPSRSPATTQRKTPMEQSCHTMDSTAAKGGAGEALVPSFSVQDTACALSSKLPFRRAHLESVLPHGISCPFFRPVSQACHDSYQPFEHTAYSSYGSAITQATPARVSEVPTFTRPSNSHTGRGTKCQETLASDSFLFGPRFIATTVEHVIG